MMACWKIALLVGSLLPGTGVLAQSGVMIDRIVATVNRQPLLESEWEDTLRMEAFLQGRPVSSFNEADRKAALNRLIDRALLSQQMQADYSPSAEEVSARIQEIRAQLKGAETDQGWREMLAQYGLTSDDLSFSISTQLRVMRFVDLRLRPSIRINRNDIDSYYSERLVPELKKAGVAPQPVDQLRPKIRELLVQQQMETVLEDWLVNLRSQSEVHIAYELPGESGTPTPGGISSNRFQTTQR